MHMSQYWFSIKIVWGPHGQFVGSRKLVFKVGKTEL